MNWLEALILAIIEGLTEFLPVSSTGHMIITTALLKLHNSDFLKVFTVNIQFGAILSVVILYWKRFFQSLDFYYKLFVAFIPAAIIGFLLGDWIDSLLESVSTVAFALLIGGFVLIFIDKLFPGTDENLTDDTKDVSYLQAFLIGCFQCIALIPGVSRSAATIIGGLTQKLNRKAAADFSFLLAVPTMFAASAYKLLKDHDAITSDNISVLLFGNLIAFIVALIAIKFFIRFVAQYGFKHFGYYRIVIGGLLLLLLYVVKVDLSIV
ncbi:MAG: undecaprenyl-diphosphate phosphatase [Cytophagaceae bacterium]